MVVFLLKKGLVGRELAVLRVYEDGVVVWLTRECS